MLYIIEKCNMLCICNLGGKHEGKEDDYDEMMNEGMFRFEKHMR